MTARQSQKAATGERGAFYTRDGVLAMLKNPMHYAAQLREAATHRGFDVVGVPSMAIVASYLYAELGELEPLQCVETIGNGRITVWR